LKVEGDVCPETRRVVRMEESAREVLDGRICGGGDGLDRENRAGQGLLVGKQNG
jgi:hypothetical protein